MINSFFRHRTKVVEASESEALPRLWRPSTEHPSGQIVVIPTPVPISSLRLFQFIVFYLIVYSPSSYTSVA
jgi:hypothetical protein